MRAASSYLAFSARRLTTHLAGCLLLGALLASGCASNAAITQGPSDGFHDRVQRDTRAMTGYRNGLRAVAAYSKARPDLFPSEKTAREALPSRDQRGALLAMWARTLDYHLGLETIRTFHSDFYLLKSAPRRTRSLVLHYAAFVAQYRFAMEWIAGVQRNPWLHEVLDEAVPALGISAGSYGRYKLRYLNALAAARFSGLTVVWKAMKPAPSPAVLAAIDEDIGGIWKMGKGRGEAMTIGNAWKIAKSSVESTWLPVQAGVAEWMGDTKVRRVHRSLVSLAQIGALLPTLQPGDIMLNRREWYLSNVGLPGFWPHAALFIGTPSTRRLYFNSDEVNAWVREQGQAGGDFEALLKRRYPKAYALGLTRQEHDHVPRVIEAISEGVSFTTIEHSAAADSLAVLRPRVAKISKARAILRAFKYSGRPYDFNFDFRTDTSLVCTELIYKAYESAKAVKGLSFPLTTVLGRPVTTANQIVQQFDATYGTDKQQVQLVTFLDGREKSGRAVEADTAAFRASWKRPKWHLFIQEEEAKDK